LQITMGVGAAFLLLLGAGIGFALGRATAPKPAPQTPIAITDETTLPAGVVEEVPTDTVDSTYADETSASTEPTADTKRPPRPTQVAPADGAVIDASRVNLHWSRVTDEGGPVIYSFEIQNRLSNGHYGETQVIKGLKVRSYSARVLTVRRRWRVWAVDAAGNASAKTGWHTYIHKYVPPKSTDSTPSASTETT